MHPNTNILPHIPIYGNIRKSNEDTGIFLRDNRRTTAGIFARDLNLCRQKSNLNHKSMTCSSIQTIRIEIHPYKDIDYVVIDTPSDFCCVSAVQIMSAALSFPFSAPNLQNQQDINRVSPSNALTYRNVLDNVLTPLHAPSIEKMTSWYDIGVLAPSSINAKKTVIALASAEKNWAKVGPMEYQIAMMTCRYGYGHCIILAREVIHNQQRVKSRIQQVQLPVVQAQLINLQPPLISQAGPIIFAQPQPVLIAQALPIVVNQVVNVVNPLDAQSLPALDSSIGAIHDTSVELPLSSTDVPLIVTSLALPIQGALVDSTTVALDDPQLPSQQSASTALLTTTQLPSQIGVLTVPITQPQQLNAVGLKAPPKATLSVNTSKTIPKKKIASPKSLVNIIDPVTLQSALVHSTSVAPDDSQLTSQQGATTALLTTTCIPSQIGTSKEVTTGPQQSTAVVLNAPSMAISLVSTSKFTPQKKLASPKSPAKKIDTVTLIVPDTLIIEASTAVIDPKPLVQISVVEAPMKEVLSKTKLRKNKKAQAKDDADKKDVQNRADAKITQAKQASIPVSFTVKTSPKLVQTVEPISQPKLVNPDAKMHTLIEETRFILVREDYGDINDMRRKLDDCYALLDNIEEGCALKIAVLDKQVEILKSDNGQLSGQVEALKADKGQLSKQNGELSDLIQDLRKQFEELSHPFIEVKKPEAPREQLWNSFVHEDRDFKSQKSASFQDKQRADREREGIKTQLNRDLGHLQRQYNSDGDFQVRATCSKSDYQEIINHVYRLTPSDKARKETDHFVVTQLAFLKLSFFKFTPWFYNSEGVMTLGAAENIFSDKQRWSAIEALYQHETITPLVKMYIQKNFTALIYDLETEVNQVTTDVVTIAGYNTARLTDLAKRDYKKTAIYTKDQTRADEKAGKNWQSKNGGSNTGTGIRSAKNNTVMQMNDPMKGQPCTKLEVISASIKKDFYSCQQSTLSSNLLLPAETVGTLSFGQHNPMQDTTATVTCYGDLALAIRSHLIQHGLGHSCDFLYKPAKTLQSGHPCMRLVTDMHTKLVVDKLQSVVRASIIDGFSQVIVDMGAKYVKFSSYIDSFKDARLGNVKYIGVRPNSDTYDVLYNKSSSAYSVLKEETFNNDLDTFLRQGEVIQHHSANIQNFPNHDKRQQVAIFLGTIERFYELMQMATSWNKLDVDASWGVDTYKTIDTLVYGNEGVLKYLTDYRNYKFSGLSIDSLYYFPELLHPMPVYAAMMEYPCMVGTYTHPQSEGYTIVCEEVEKTTVYQTIKAYVQAQTGSHGGPSYSHRSSAVCVPSKNIMLCGLTWHCIEAPPNVQICTLVKYPIAMLSYDVKAWFPSFQFKRTSNQAAIISRVVNEDFNWSAFLLLWNARTKVLSDDFDVNAKLLPFLYSSFRSYNKQMTYKGSPFFDSRVMAEFQLSQALQNKLSPTSALITYTSTGITLKVKQMVNRVTNICAIEKRLEFDQDGTPTGTRTSQIRSSKFQYVQHSLTEQQWKDLGTHGAIKKVKKQLDYSAYKEFMNDVKVTPPVVSGLPPHDRVAVEYNNSTPGSVSFALGNRLLSSPVLPDQNMLYGIVMRRGVTYDNFQQYCKRNITRIVERMKKQDIEHKSITQWIQGHKGWGDTKKRAYSRDIGDILVELRKDEPHFRNSTFKILGKKGEQYSVFDHEIVDGQNTKKSVRARNIFDIPRDFKLSAYMISPLLPRLKKAVRAVVHGDNTESFKVKYERARSHVQDARVLSLDGSCFEGSQSLHIKQIIKHEFFRQCEPIIRAFAEQLDPDLADNIMKLVMQQMLRNTTNIVQEYKLDGKMERLLDLLIDGLTVSGDPATTIDNTLTTILLRGYEAYLLDLGDLPLEEDDALYDLLVAGDDSIVLTPADQQQAWCDLIAELSASSAVAQVIGLGQIVKEVKVGRHIYDFDFCSKESYLCSETGAHFLVSDMSKRILCGQHYCGEVASMTANPGEHSYAIGYSMLQEALTPVMQAYAEARMRISGYNNSSFDATKLDVLNEYRIHGEKTPFTIDVIQQMDRVLADKIGMDYENLYSLIPQYNSAKKIGDTICLVRSSKRLSQVNRSAERKLEKSGSPKALTQRPHSSFTSRPIHATIPSVALGIDQQIGCALQPVSLSALHSIPVSMTDAVSEDTIPP